MAKIKAPNNDYTGISAGVTFVKGEAETDDKWLIEWFKNKGYKVDDSAEKEAEEAKHIAEEKAKKEAEAKAKAKAEEEANKKAEAAQNENKQAPSK